MSIIIKPLSMSEDEINSLEKIEGPWKKNVKKAHIEMYHMQRPSEDDIRAFEVNVGELPKDYREFLMEFNGGTPFPNIVVTADDELVINFFLPLKYPNGYQDHLFRYIEDYAERIPRGMIPIASSGGGDLVLIHVGNSEDQKVYYWSHEMESESDASDYYENVEVIAGSFTEILNSLRELE